MRTSEKITTTELVMTALCTAVIAVLAQIAVPVPGSVPVTLQTFAVALCGYILGWKLGLVSVVVYILLGAVGAPVFTGFKGSVGSLLGVTGGFIWGFLPMAALCGLGSELRFGKAAGVKRIVWAVFFGMLGIVACHGAGVLWYAFVSKIHLAAAFMTVSLPFLLKDAASVIAACLVSGVVKKVLYRANVMERA